MVPGHEMHWCKRGVILCEGVVWVVWVGVGETVDGLNLSPWNNLPAQGDDGHQ